MSSATSFRGTSRDSGKLTRISWFINWDRLMDAWMAPALCTASSTLPLEPATMRARSSMPLAPVSSAAAWGAGAGAGCGAARSGPTGNSTGSSSMTGCDGALLLRGNGGRGCFHEIEGRRPQGG